MKKHLYSRWLAGMLAAGVAFTSVSGQTVVRAAEESVEEGALDENDVVSEEPSPVGTEVDASGEQTENLLLNEEGDPDGETKEDPDGETDGETEEDPDGETEESGKTDIANAEFYLESAGYYSCIEGSTFSITPKVHGALQKEDSSIVSLKQDTDFSVFPYEITHEDEQFTGAGTYDIPLEIYGEGDYTGEYTGDPLTITVKILAKNTKGKHGDNLTWELKNGTTLTFTGSGAMSGWGWGNEPGWKD